MNVKLQWVTPEADKQIAYMARVSAPANQANESIEGLLRYCMREGHVSPFEMANACIEINTTRDIGRQILRHRSFSFQEFCVAEGTQVTTVTKLGRTKKIPIEKLFAYQFDNRMAAVWDRGIRVYDEDSRTFVRSKLKEVFNTGIKPCFEVALSDGKTITCTAQHRFLTRGGYADLSTLSIGDFVAVNGVDTYKSLDWKEIVSIAPAGEKQTYDLEVEHPSHNYVADGIVTHNSQRYASTDALPEAPLRECRLQDTKNRQSSLPTDERWLIEAWENVQNACLASTTEAYQWALSKGIAKEQARALLPEGLTSSRLYMNGNMRSWIHYLQSRLHASTQLEHRGIAQQALIVLRKVAPVTIGAFFPESEK